MSKNSCTTENCPVHTRTNGTKPFSDGKGMAAKVTYTGDYAVVTRVNSVLGHDAAMLLRMLGAPADLYYTFILKVDGQSLGSFLAESGEKEDDALYERLLFIETHTLDTHFPDQESMPSAEADAKTFHDSIVDALKASALDLDNSIGRQGYVEALYKSIKPTPGEL